MLCWALAVACAGQSSSCACNVLTSWMHCTPDYPIPCYHELPDVKAFRAAQPLGARVGQVRASPAAEQHVQAVCTICMVIRPAAF